MLVEKLRSAAPRISPFIWKLQSLSPPDGLGEMHPGMPSLRSVAQQVTSQTRSSLGAAEGCNPYSQHSGLPDSADIAHVFGEFDCQRRRVSVSPMTVITNVADGWNNIQRAYLLLRVSHKENRNRAQRVGGYEFDRRNLPLKRQSQHGAAPSQPPTHPAPSDSSFCPRRGQAATST